MSISAIGTHSKRGYQGLQLLSAVSALALAVAFFSLGDSEPLTWTLGMGAAANLLAMGALYRHQRVIRQHIQRARVDEVEKSLIMRTDTLTGAMMRGYFLKKVQESLGPPLAPREAMLLLVDLDHFKQLNDSFGHPFGDMVLTHLVNVMKRHFPNGVVGRMGGDEFAILIPNADIETTRLRAAAMIEQLRNGIGYQNYTVPLSASIGAAVAPLHASQPKEMMLLADLALYESKAAGRGRMTVFDTGLLSDKRHRRFIERELRAAIYLNELELHYQPIVNADGSVYAVEGLVRWRHPVRGLIPPGEFVPIAEKSNLIDTLGAWVFRRACLDVPDFPGCRISINVSGEQLSRILKETGQTADRFVLEITETATTSASPEVLARLEKARAMGFRVALDDFGTGFCGFNYLKTLPIDAIKIDRSYIQSLADDDVARILVSALAQIANVQDLTIVAEGVETRSDLELARAAGCKRFQGYHISRPVPKDKLQSFFPQHEAALQLAC
jgi:diguanylate cyclase (GGDEF)-like protein